MTKEIRLTRLWAGVLGVLLLAATAAYAQKVMVNYVPGTDFSKYKTYRWVAVEGAQKPDAILDSQITQAVEKVLASKGLKKVEGDEATLFIAYQLALGQQQQLYTYSTGGYGWRYGAGTSTTTSETITVGAIVLHLYDPAKKELVWKGQASKTVDEGAKPEKRQKNLDKAMGKLLKDFPPKPETT
jgi:Domain of unknown function (DUF4136)